MFMSQPLKVKQSNKQTSYIFWADLKKKLINLELHNGSLIPQLQNRTVTLSLQWYHWKNCSSETNQETLYILNSMNHPQLGHTESQRLSDKICNSHIQQFRYCIESAIYKKFSNHIHANFFLYNSFKISLCSCFFTVLFTFLPFIFY